MKWSLLSLSWLRNADQTLGVISGVGKGTIASSTGLLLKTIGLTVSSIVSCTRDHDFVPALLP